MKIYIRVAISPYSVGFLALILTKPTYYKYESPSSSNPNPPTNRRLSQHSQTDKQARINIQNAPPKPISTRTRPLTSRCIHHPNQRPKLGNLAMDRLSMRRQTHPRPPHARHPQRRKLPGDGDVLRVLWRLAQFPLAPAPWRQVHDALCLCVCEHWVYRKFCFLCYSEGSELYECEYWGKCREFGI